jgi:hypothetical protein
MTVCKRKRLQNVGEKVKGGWQIVGEEDDRIKRGRLHNKG